MNTKFISRQEDEKTLYFSTMKKTNFIKKINLIAFVAFLSVTTQYLRNLQPMSCNGIITEASNQRQLFLSVLDSF